MTRSKTKIGTRLNELNRLWKFGLRRFDNGFTGILRIIVDAENLNIIYDRLLRKTVQKIWQIFLVVVGDEADGEITIHGINLERSYIIIV